MSSSNLLMQYQSKCPETLKSVTKASKPFEKVLMDTLKSSWQFPARSISFRSADTASSQNRPTATT